MISLTRVDAAERARVLRVEAYLVRLDVDGTGRTFDSVTTIRFACSEPGAATFVDVRPDRMNAATLNGVALDCGAGFDVRSGRLRLDGLAADNELIVDARMAYSHDGEGLHRHVDPADGETYLYAMSFLDAAPRWFACFDQPDLKAPITLDVRCPPRWTVAGNGPAVLRSPGVWHLAATGPVATYATTLVAGPYHSRRATHDGIPLALHVRRSLAEHLDRDADELFTVTRRCFDELHALFGVRYPWGEYHQAFVPEFNAGAMENPGCVTLRDGLVFRSRATDADRADRAVTIAHEMAHMWFGDLVTMRWWDDLWLNESFAEYLGHRVTGARSWIAFGIERKSWGYRADRRPSTHPIAGNGAVDAASALNEFDGISYAKGASALRQLSVHLGDEVFLAGLRTYVADHADGNAELADLLAAWRAAGARGLDAWAQSWLRTSGMDRLRVDGAQIRCAGEPTRPHTVDVAGVTRSGARTWTRTVTLDAERTTLDAPAADLVLVDSADETWAKVELEATAWAAMGRTLPGLDDPRSRVTVWNAIMLATADAEVDPSLALDIVLAAIPHETDDAVLSVVGGWAARTVVGSYLTDAVRPAAADRLGAAMLDLAAAAGPGSGRQLAAARVAIAGTAHGRLLRDWLGGHRVPDGMEVDVELRWAILTRLAALGELAAAEIKAEAAADHSTSGAVHAARCHAARPDAGAKAAAWTAMLTDAERSNYELYALAEGFWQPEQRDLTDPFVERYFAEIAATAQLRSGWVIDRLALLAYPGTAVARPTLDATDRLVADPSLHSGIRRSVVDAGDDLRRALAVRRRYGGQGPGE